MNTKDFNKTTFMEEKNIVHEIEMFKEHARNFKRIMVNSLKDVFEKIKTDLDKQGHPEIFNNLFADSYEETLIIEQREFSLDDIKFLMNEYNFLKSVKDRLAEKIMK